MDDYSVASSQELVATDYTRNPDGTFTFTLDDGRRVTAAGPAAEQRARELDAAMPRRTRTPAEIAREQEEARRRAIVGGGNASKVADALANYTPPEPPRVPEGAEWVLDPSRASLASFDFRPVEQQPRWKQDEQRARSARMSGLLGGAASDTLEALGVRRPLAPRGEQAPADAQPEPMAPGRFAGEGTPTQAPQRPAVVVLPGGELLAGRTTQHGPGLTGEQQEQLAELSVDRRLAMQQMADAERLAQTGRTRAAVLEQQNYVAEDRRLREAEAARIAREESAIEEARQAEQRASEYVVNPRRFWSNMGGWEKALAVLASGLGGALAVRDPQGRNRFAEALERVIADDVAAQREELAALERDARAKGDYARAVQLANDRARLSDAELFEHRLRSLSAYAQRIAAETQDPIIAARARMADLDIQELLTERMISADQERRGTEVRQYQNVPTQVVQVGGQDPSLPDYSPKELDAQARDYAQRLESRGIVEGAAALDDVDQMLLRYDPDESIPGLGLIKEYVPRWLLTEEGKLNRQRVSRLMDAYRVAVTGAGASNEELKRIEDSFRGAKTPAELRQAVRLSRDILNKRQRTLAAAYDPRAIEIAESRGAYRPPTAPSSLRRGAIGGQ